MSLTLSSSLRTQGPITTGRHVAARRLPLCPKKDHAVWVPAFAGTTVAFLFALPVIPGRAPARTRNLAETGSIFNFEIPDRSALRTVRNDGER
jgi:hypothetical protein